MTHTIRKLSVAFDVFAPVILMAIVAMSYLNNPVAEKKVNDVKIEKHQDNKEDDPVIKGLLLECKRQKN